MKKGSITYRLIPRWTARHAGRTHVIVFYPTLNLADLFIHGSHSEVIAYHPNIVHGMRNAANFARRIGAHMSLSDIHSLNLVPCKRNLGKGRWAKR